MQPIQLFELASQQARWLSTRQAAIAQNISNANTPGYKALDVHPFADVLAKAELPMAASNVAHFTGVSTAVGGVPGTKPDDSPWEVTHTGNSVSLEQELMKAGDVNRSFSLDTGILKAFHGMLMTSVKTG